MGKKENILRNRTDMTGYLLHWTRKSTLGQILQSGVLKATHAERRHIEDGEYYPHICKGPAVCFSEMPLGHYRQSIIGDPSRYSPYAIAIPKKDIYDYGGRPVIYGDYKLLDRLDDEDKYLFVNYNPSGID